MKWTLNWQCETYWCGGNAAGAELDLDIFHMLAVVLQTDNKISAPAAGMYLRSESIQSEWSLKNLQ